ncbi:mitochondrial fission regulator 2 [Chanos chanos]|uniref:Mitochondrial fission regulator n=1 Tax=Chanos chanos TaxID=29144 RepID=A0A6J2WHH2_CHACN|nr:mitochondrial fission regulator 2 [Chanos chanos]
MSLLEDIVDLLRYVLEYFGVPTDMLVPVWDSPLCGQYRSIVRMIGTNLPLSPNPRVFFQIPLQTSKRHGHIDVSLETPAIPSLADVLWLAEDEGESFAKFRNALPFKRNTVPQGFMTPPVHPGGSASVIMPVQQGARVTGQRSHPEALQKITALEAELMRLRAQIAMIVTSSSGPSTLPCDPGTPCSVPLSAPALTSTPVCPPPPPPPLPPPLPPAAPHGSSDISVLEVIKQRREGRAERPKQGEPSAGTVPAAVPSMLEVLKDLNQVRLRATERSPGGTPVRKRRSKGNVCPSDPAALIAEALKRKFSHRQQDDSFDKENRSAEPSPFSSPDTPRISHHTRRSQGRMHL